MYRKFEVVWTDFNTVCTFELADDENPNLCDEFWQSLPFTTIFAASMSAGEMFKVPIPKVLSSEPEGELALFPDQPVGTVLSFASMSGLLIKYGIVVEPFRLPRIGRLLKGEIGTFKDLSGKLRDAYFFTKEVNLALVRKQTEPGG